MKVKIKNESENESENENEHDGVTTRILNGVNADRVEECDYVDVDVNDGSGTTTHLQSSIPPPPPPMIT